MAESHELHIVFSNRHGAEGVRSRLIQDHGLHGDQLFLVRVPIEVDAHAQTGADDDRSLVMSLLAGAGIGAGIGLAVVGALLLTNFQPVAAEPFVAMLGAVGFGVLVGVVGAWAVAPPLSETTTAVEERLPRERWVLIVHARDKRQARLTEMQLARDGYRARARLNAPTVCEAPPNGNDLH